MTCLKWPSHDSHRGQMHTCLEMQVVQTSADVSHQRVLILRAQTDVLVRALGNIKVYLSEMPPSPHSDVMRALLVKASADLLRLAGPDESEDAA